MRGDPHLDRMPLGDREPAAKASAARHLRVLVPLILSPPAPAELVAWERSVANRRAALGRLHRAAERLGLQLQPAVARLATTRKLGRTIVTKIDPAAFPMWSEDLSEQPQHARIRDLLREMIVSEGIAPADVLDAALANAVALSLEVRGLVETSLSMYRAGATLASTCPEIQAVAAESLRLTNAIQDRVEEMGGRRQPGRPRADH